MMPTTFEILQESNMNTGHCWKNIDLQTSQKKRIVLSTRSGQFHSKNLEYNCGEFGHHAPKHLPPRPQTYGTTPPTLGYALRETSRQLTGTQDKIFSEPHVAYGYPRQNLSGATFCLRVPETKSFGSETNFRQIVTPANRQIWDKFETNCRQMGLRASLLQRQILDTFQTNLRQI